MTTTDTQATRITESYPGETLALLRKVSADLDYLRGEVAAFEPLLATLRAGGLLAARRVARGGRRGVTPERVL